MGHNHSMYFFFSFIYLYILLAKFYRKDRLLVKTMLSLLINKLIYIYIYMICFEIY
jgi:hypothetical protein